MTFRLAPWPRAFKFIGDSHAARFDGLVFHDDEQRRFIITQAHNHYGFRSADVADAGGLLNERLVRSLLTFNLLRGTRENAIPALGTFRTAPAPDGWEFGLRVRQSYRSEVLVISSGEVDARDIIRRLPLDAAVAMNTPIATFSDDPAADAGAIAEAELAQEIEAEYLAPLFYGLRTLREIGIGRLYLLALPPPGLNDADYAAHCGFNSRRHVRYAVHRTINGCYERFCRANGIAFLDSWPLVTGDDGKLRADFGSDGVHLNRAGAVAIVEELARRTAADAPPALDPLV